jgi:hypothetical protein
MPEDTTYNGWTNYETSCVNLWIDNDQGSQEYWRDQAKEHWENPIKLLADFSRSERARAGLAAQLKDEIEDDNPLADDASM